MHPQKKKKNRFIFAGAKERGEGRAYIAPGDVDGARYKVYRIAGKFGGDLNLAVGGSRYIRARTAKLKPATISVLHL